MRPIAGHPSNYKFFQTMKNNQPMRIQLLTLSLTLYTISTPAFAYIDPASGSAIMSAIIGFAVAIAMAVKTYWYKLKSLFTSKQTDDKDENKTDSPGS